MLRFRLIQKRDFGAVVYFTYESLRTRIDFVLLVPKDLCRFSGSDNLEQPKTQQQIPEKRFLAARKPGMGMLNDTLQDEHEVH